MQEASNEATAESTGVDVTETVQEAADAVASMDPNRIMEFLQNNGLDSSTFVALGKNIVVAILIYYIGRFIIRLVVGGLRKIMQRQNVDKSSAFVENEETGAVGLALQGSLSNFAAGVLIVLFRPYKVGDFVEAAGVSGSVEQVQILTTVLKTPDNKKIIVPNSQIMDSIITNYSANETRRVDLTVGVSYDDDIDKVSATLRELVDAEERILKEPECLIKVQALADSSVNFIVRPWVKTADYWGVYFDLTEAIKKRFDEDDITFPFPQQDVHVYKAN